MQSCAQLLCLVGTSSVHEEMCTTLHLLLFMGNWIDCMHAVLADGPPVLEFTRPQLQQGITGMLLHRMLCVGRSARVFYTQQTVLAMRFCAGVWRFRHTCPCKHQMGHTQPRCVLLLPALNNCLHVHFYVSHASRHCPSINILTFFSHVHARTLYSYSPCCYGIVHPMIVNLPCKQNRKTAPACSTKLCTFDPSPCHVVVCCAL